MIYADFESILAPEDNEKQTPEECHVKKYQKYLACSYGYKLICVDDKFNKPFKSYLGKDTVHNFINNTSEEIKYYGELMKKHLNKELVMTKEGNEDFENPTKC